MILLYQTRPLPGRSFPAFKVCQQWLYLSTLLSVQCPRIEEEEKESSMVKWFFLQSCRKKKMMIIIVMILQFVTLHVEARPGPAWRNTFFLIVTVCAWTGRRPRFCLWPVMINTVLQHALWEAHVCFSVISLSIPGTWARHLLSFCRESPQSQRNVLQMCRLLVFPPQNWAWVYVELYLKQERRDCKNTGNIHIMFVSFCPEVLLPVLYHLPGAHCTAVTWGQCSGLISRLKIKWCNCTSNHIFF